MKISDLSESITSAGSVAAVPSSLGKTQRRKTKSKKKTRNESDHVNENDIIISPNHGKVIKTDHKEHSVEMALSDLYQAAKSAKVLYDIIKRTPESDGIEGWVQEKIIKANDYLGTIREYLEHRSYMSGSAVSEHYAKWDGPLRLGPRSGRDREYDLAARYQPPKPGEPGYEEHLEVENHHKARTLAHRAINHLKDKLDPVKDANHDLLDPEKRSIKRRELTKKFFDLLQRGVDIAQEAYDPRDERDVMYRYDPKKEKLFRADIIHAELDRKKREGWRISPELAMKAHGYIPSKYKQGHFVKREGDKWVTVNPYADESKLNEKAVSKQQQKFMGMVRAAQKGETPASKEVADVAKSMKPSDTKKFASTKHKGLPKRK